MRLVSENIGGNTHDAVRYVNKRGLADYVIHFCTVGYSTIVVYRLPARHPMVLEAQADAKRAREWTAEYNRTGVRPPDDWVKPTVLAADPGLADRGYTQAELDRMHGKYNPDNDGPESTMSGGGNASNPPRRGGL